MKAFNWIWIVLFIIFAGLQYNDPDPYIWMPIYLYAAFLCYQSIKGKFNMTLYIIGFVVYTAYAVGLVFDSDGVISWLGLHHAENIAQSMHAEKPWIEETRECFGLLICDAVLLINLIYMRIKNKKST